MSGFERPTGSTGGDSTPIEALGKGKYKARLVGVVNLGTFQDTYKGETKDPASKMSILLEVIGETITLGDETVPRTMWVNPFNFFPSLTERGNELKYYSAFDEMAEPKDVPNWEGQMAKGVYIVNKPNDKGYDNIVALTAMDEEIEDNLDAPITELFIDSAENVEGKLFGLAKYQFEQPHYDEGRGNQAPPPADSDDGDNPFS